MGGLRRYKMMVFSNPQPGHEEEYNDWYQDTHLADLVALDGIYSARRYRFARNLKGDDAHAYMAIYEIETDDIDAVLGQLGVAAGDGRIRMSGAIDTAGSLALVYEEFGPPVDSGS
ncbi:MAG: hypothetical protein HKN19_00850 [Halioglobus sp.]|nr:hypothetical protein [Halioglobus sp.]